MTGNIDNDPTIEEALLSAVNSALLASSSCNTVTNFVNCHSGIGGRMVDPPITICDSVALNVYKQVLSRERLLTYEQPAMHRSQLSSSNPIQLCRCKFR